MNASRSGGSSAGAYGDLASFEVAEDLLPFLIGRNPVFIGRAHRAASGEKGQMGLDRLLWIDGLVADRDVDVLVTRDDLGNMRRQAAENSVGNEEPPKIVRGELK